MELLDWAEVERALDAVEEGDSAGVVAVFLRYEGMPLAERDGRGARRTVTVSSFCQRFGFYRATMRSWLARHGEETA